MSSSVGARRATVRFLTKEEGGRFTDLLSPGRSQLQMGSQMVSCIVTALEGDGLIRLGQSVDVEIAILMPDLAPMEFSELPEVTLREGTKLVAVGRFETTITKAEGIDGRPPEGDPSLPI